MGGRGYRPALHIPPPVLHSTCPLTFSALCAASAPERRRRRALPRATFPTFRSARRSLSRRTPDLPEEEPPTAAVTQELDHAWARIAAELRRAVTDSTYAIWLEPLRPVALAGDTV